MFSRISAKNLFSWRSLDFDIPQGITLIDGYNYDDDTPEGSGKSSIFNILTWTLYGQVPKGVKIDEVIKHGEKTAVGEVELEDGIIIHRSRKPNRLYIMSDGQKITGKDAKETQDIINRLIGMNFFTFCQTVYFAQNHNSRFIWANEADKAKILSEIQDLSIYDRAREFTKTKIRELDSYINDIAHKRELLALKLEDANKNIDRLKDIIATMRSARDEEEKRLRDSKKELEKELKRLTEEQRVLPKDEQAASFYKEKLSKVREARIVVENKLNEIRSSAKYEEKLEKAFTATETGIFELNEGLKKLKDKHSACPTCGSPLKGEAKKKAEEKFLEEEEKIQKKLDQLIKQRESLVLEAGEIKALKNNVSDLKNELKNIIEKEEELQAAGEEELRKIEKSKAITAQIYRVKTDISKVENSLENLDKKYNGDKYIEELKALKLQKTALKEEVRSLEQELRNTTHTKDQLEILKSGFKELKSYVFQNLLHNISVKATKLAQQLFEYPISIKFKNETEAGISKIYTEIMMDGREFGLGLLSGGQARRVQLAVDLALSEIVADRAENPINFRILDEVFKDLSSNSMEKMVKLLRKLKGSTLIIEHNEIIKSVMENRVFVELKEGTSNLCQ